MSCIFGICRYHQFLCKIVGKINQSYIEIWQLYQFSQSIERLSTWCLQQSFSLSNANIIKRIEVRTRLAVFTDRQCERDNGRLSVNSLAVIQIIRQAGVLLSKE